MPLTISGKRVTSSTLVTGRPQAAMERAVPPVDRSSKLASETGRQHSRGEGDGGRESERVGQGGTGRVTGTRTHLSCLKTHSCFSRVAGNEGHEA